VGLTGSEDWTRVVAGLVLLATQVLRLHTPVAVAAATLAAAALFNPLAVVNRAVEPAHLSVWIDTGRPGPSA
jgi:hypothetical protein